MLSGAEPCAVLCLQCFLLWFAAQYLFNVSLGMTSVTSNTILSSSSSLFTFALSMMLLKEPYSVAKLLSIAACMGGECVARADYTSCSILTFPLFEYAFAHQTL